MPKHWWFQFDFRVWRTDSSLRRCSFETRGFWLEVLCVMHETGEYQLSGSYEEIGRMIGCTPELAARCVIELKRTGTADVTEMSQDVTLGHGGVTIMSRRLKRELSIREQNRLRKQRQRVTQRSHDIIRSKSNKKEIREEREAATPPAHKDQEPDFSTFEEPMMRVYREFFPDASVSPFLQDLIASRVTNEPAWRKALTFWQYNSYRANSIGKIVDYYDEVLAGKHDKNGSAPRFDPGRNEEVETFEDVPPCSVCGKDVCLTIHREQVAA